MVKQRAGSWFNKQGLIEKSLLGTEDHSLLLSVCLVGKKEGAQVREYAALQMEGSAIQSIVMQDVKRLSARLLVCNMQPASILLPCLFTYELECMPECVY